MATKAVEKGFASSETTQRKGVRELLTKSGDALPLREVFAGEPPAPVDDGTIVHKYTTIVTEKIDPKYEDRDKRFTATQNFLGRIQLLTFSAAVVSLALLTLTVPAITGIATLSLLAGGFLGLCATAARVIHFVATVPIRPAPIKVENTVERIK